MSWIESHSGLLNHPKLSALAQAMGWDKFHASGRLHCLWHWAIEYAPTGDLRRFNDTQLAAAVELDPADGKRWVEALCSDQSRWIDRGQDAHGQPIFRIHDWPDYAGKFLKGRWNGKPEKWKEVQAVYANALAPPSIVTQDKLDAPYRTVPTNQPTEPDDGAGGRARGGLGGDALDAEIRKFIGEHPRLPWDDPKTHANVRALVTKFGWAEARTWIDSAPEGTQFPAGWALSACSNHHAKAAAKAGATSDSANLLKQRLAEVAARKK